ncbi:MULTISPECIES: ABC transporter substrate-binding protein [unclassified Aminobacter]|uniref:ABC transporter substrate-binding protein n=1 Tax=unclassified Aminobacter TaxID=2644704 RepID=UPI000466EA81|nr:MULTISPECIES: ABC transporter substrate-binding protein [unclassified Aminobacter]TWG53950.1 amino acid/amide ABC transporter substrate-binding protein, HAAT family (TC 3.A.1.4.-) [Aminobacter sp. J44]TWH25909.1 amino acid/amide ABC transporter substrate-binding protein, HAAT family (TC 3.A.1.4.-) [Aminobacter sp. J15]
MTAQIKATLLATVFALGLAAPVAAQEALKLPNMSYRTGPFAATGTPHMNGQLDYMTMLNERDGGINGVKIAFDECETGYNTEKGVECYEKTKADGALVTQPWSTGITLQVLPRAGVDEIPMYAPGYGFSAMQDGKTFKWAFNPPTSYWDGASMILQGISDGNLDNLNGKKIAFLHLDHPYGKEPIPLLESLASKHGFTLLPIPVGLTEMQNQSAQWLQIRREKPDFVVMWGWGAMNGSAISEAVKTRYPMNQFVSVWWGAHEPDLKLVGEQGKGYRALSWNFADSESKLMQDVKKYVVDAGKSQINAEAGEFDSTAYQRGILMSVILAEAVKAAQDKAGTPNINREQLRVGLENVNIDAARLAELGAENMMAPFAMSCSNHTGHASAWMVEWDGSKFVKVSDLLTADRSVIDPLVEKAAADYAAANQPWSMNDECK